MAGTTFAFIWPNDSSDPLRVLSLRLDCSSRRFCCAQTGLVPARSIDTINAVQKQGLDFTIGLTHKRDPLNMS
jgi:hypothetical protein